MSAAFPRVSFGAPVFRIKENNTQPPITFQAVDEDAQVVSLVGAISVQFRYRLREALPATAVTKFATIVNAANGELRYDFVSVDTAIAGDYYAEWLVLFPSTQTRTFPVRGFQSFVVEVDLG